VHVLTSPRLEGTIEAGHGRRLSFAEFGNPHGRPVVWMHGTPGARRQIPDAARIAAEELDIRLIGIDRPGVGSSTPHLYSQIADWVDDFQQVLESLGIGDFAMLGLSGGGPYVLATAHAMPERMTVAGVLGGVAPTVGPDATEGGIVSLAARFNPLLTRLRAPLTWGLTGVIWGLRPFASPGLKLYARLSPPGDRLVFARPEIRAMFIDDLLLGSRPGLSAPVYDIVLFGRDWGFSVRDIKVPVHWWHGDADHIVPLRHCEHVVSLLPDAQLYVRSGESHLGTLIAAEEILGTLMGTWDEREVSAR
jgi:pimeloyl-ACP methyl ester carboxylesterase